MSYNSLGVNGLIAAVIRVLIYICQTISMFSVLSLIPSKKYSITSIGANTLPIYIVHGFLVKSLLVTKFYSNASFINLLLILFFSTGIVYFIGDKFMIKSKAKEVNLKEINNN